MSERLYIQLAKLIIKDVKAGIFVVGSRLESERKLSEKYEVSRSVIREAMVYLELVGVVEIKRGSGVTIIKDEALPLSTELPEITPSDVMQSRLYLEPIFASIMAENATEEQINELDNCVKLMEAAQYFSSPDLIKKASVDADVQFHKLMRKGCNNSLLYKIHTELLNYHMDNDMWLILNKLADEPAEKGVWTEDHKNILDAIKQRNPQKAHDAMKHHIEKVIYDIT